MNNNHKEEVYYIEKNMISQNVMVLILLTVNIALCTIHGYDNLGWKHGRNSIDVIPNKQDHVATIITMFKIKLFLALFREESD